MAKRVVGGIAVDLIAGTQQWSKGFNRAEKQAHGFRKAIDQSLTKIIGFAAVYRGLQRVIGMFNETRRAIDNLAKTADRLNLTTEALAGFQFAAKLAGATSQDVARALTYMTRTIGEAAAKGGEYEEVLRRIGVSTSELLGMSTEEQYKRISDAINELGTASEKTSATMRIFGESGVKMMTLIAGGGGALDRAISKTKEYGTAVKRDAAGRVEEMNDILTEAGEIWEGIKRTVVETGATALVEVVKKTRQWQKDLDRTGELGWFQAFIGVRSKADIQTMLTGAGELIIDMEYLNERLRSGEATWGTLRKAEQQALMDEMEQRFAREKVLREQSAQVAQAVEKKKTQAWRTSLGYMQTITTQLASESEGWFKINKAVSIANAVMDTNAAMVKARKELGPVAGVAMATVIGALGLANIAAIRATTFEGGGTVAGAGGAVTTAPAAATAEPAVQKVFNLNVSGERFGREDFIQIGRGLAELEGDGFQFNVRTN